MTTQKTFKQRIRARAAKTGESYTTARAQLLRKADADAARNADTVSEPPAPASEPEPDTVALTGVSDEALLRGSGHPMTHWLGILDRWGARDHSHRDIARWLMDEQSVPGWWAQTITVGYERARGMRAIHEQPSGFAVSASRTVGASADAALAAFTDPSIRDRWLPDAPMRRRRTTAANGARFDWDEPPSRVVVGISPKPDGRAQVSVSHEKLADADAGERLKLMWRERLGALKQLLEGELGR